MNILSRVKSLVSGSDSSVQRPNQQINIINRGDGLSVSGLPPYIASWVPEYPKTLYCGDGTHLPITVTNSLITGSSAHRSEILIRQIAKALLEGYTPVVLSSNGKSGEMYSILRTIYPEHALRYIADSTDSGCYNPFEGISPERIAEFFYHLTTTFQQQPTNGMLVRNYINVCVRVFFASGNAVHGLIMGQINHMRLLNEIASMCENNLISEQERMQLQDIADSSRDASVLVLSVIQDYMYKMQRANASRPSIQIRQANVPQISIQRINGQQVQPQQIVTQRNSGTYNARKVIQRECLFLNIENDVPGVVFNAPNAQCFQWYLSRTLQTEFDAAPNLKNARILLIVDNLSSLQIRWFLWLSLLPNCVFLLNYEDFYSTLADAAELREQLIGRTDRIFFFAMMNEQSASWASRFFGTHTVEKNIYTEPPVRSFSDLFFRPKAVTHDQEEKPWFNPYEIQHLVDSGIVYCKRDKVFQPLYCENGNLYKEKNYRGQKINFSKFSFRQGG